MTSHSLQAYFTATTADQRVIIFPWGVIEAYGQEPLGSDTMFVAVMADKLVERLQTLSYQPIIFDMFKDIGAPSATYDFSGSIGISSTTVPVIPQLWKQSLLQLGSVRNGAFKQFILLNGDGGNDRTHWASLSWDPEIRLSLQASGGVFDCFCWDKDAQGHQVFHGGTLLLALAKWMCDFAPRDVRMSAARHGLWAPPDEQLECFDGVDMKFIENPPAVDHYWSEHPQQRELLAMQEFDFPKYRAWLYDDDSDTPRTSGGIGQLFENIIESLTNRVVKTLQHARQL